MLTKYWIPFGALLVLLALFMFGENALAPNFQVCLSQHAATQGNEETQEQARIGLKTIAAESLCTLQLIDRHNGFFAAIAAFAVAVFTFTLWRSTEKLWNASERDFISTHRPKLIVREVLRLPSRTRQNIELRYVIANVGGSDAEVVESHVEVQEVRDGILRPMQPVEDANPIGRRTIKPGGVIFDEYSSTVSVMSLVVSRMADGRRLPRGRADLNENRAVCFRGFLVYADRNGIRRRCGFCRVFDSQAERFYPLDDPDYEYAD